MCLGLPGRILSIDDKTALVDFNGIRRKADVSLLSTVTIGDYVLVHAGFAIERYDEEAAEETLSLLKEIADGATDQIQ